MILGRTPLGLLDFGGIGVPPAPFLIEGEVANFVASLLGNCYPSHLPQGVSEWPLVSYNVIDGRPIMSLGGSAGLSRVSIQFDAWSDQAAEAMLAQARLAKALVGFAGPMGKASLLGVFRKRSQTSYFPAVDGSDQGYHRALGEYEFYYVDQ